ncbi:MAG: hypothetical protein ACREV4_11300 [Gammaproteobacteria bacterium]
MFATYVPIFPVLLLGVWPLRLCEGGCSDYLTLVPIILVLTGSFRLGMIPTVGDWDFWIAAFVRLRALYGFTMTNDRVSAWLDDLGLGV